MWNIFDQGGQKNEQKNEQKKSKSKSKSVKSVHYYKPHNSSQSNHKKQKQQQQKQQQVIGKIYADWCGHCTALIPEWKIMKDNIQNNFPDKYIFSEIEETNKDTEVAKINKMFVYKSNKVDVQGGYPTIYKIQNGKVEYYTGARQAPDMESWFIMDNNKSNKENFINGGRNRQRNTRRKRK